MVPSGLIDSAPAPVTVLIRVSSSAFSVIPPLRMAPPSLRYAWVVSVTVFTAASPARATPLVAWTGPAWPCCWAGEPVGMFEASAPTRPKLHSRPVEVASSSNWLTFNTLPSEPMVWSSSVRCLPTIARVVRSASSRAKPTPMPSRLASWAEPARLVCVVWSSAVTLTGPPVTCTPLANWAIVSLV